MKNESVADLINQKLIEIQTSISTIEKKLNILDIRVVLIDKQMVNIDYLEYKLDEINEYIEDEYSLLYEDLQVIKEAVEESAYVEKRSNKEIKKLRNLLWKIQLRE
jgi:hypothetical protein